MQSPKNISERHSTILRMEKELYEKLRVIASEDGRSVNQQVLYYIRKALAERKA